VVFRVQDPVLLRGRPRLRRRAVPGAGPGPVGGRARRGQRRHHHRARGDARRALPAAVGRNHIAVHDVGVRPTDPLSTEDVRSMFTPPTRMKFMPSCADPRTARTALRRCRRAEVPADFGEVVDAVTAFADPLARLTAKLRWHVAGGGSRRRSQQRSQSQSPRRSGTPRDGGGRIRTRGTVDVLPAPFRGCVAVGYDRTWVDTTGRRWTAQTVRRVHGMEEVRGSIPLSSTQDRRSAACSVIAQPST
jgi:hypothetical protein